MIGLSDLLEIAETVDTSAPAEKTRTRMYPWVLNLDSEHWEFVECCGDTRRDRRVIPMHKCDACPNNNVQIVIKVYHRGLDRDPKNLYIGENCAARLFGYGEDVVRFRRDYRTSEQRLRDQISYAEEQIKELEIRTATIGDIIKRARSQHQRNADQMVRDYSHGLGTLRGRIESAHGEIETARRAIERNTIAIDNATQPAALRLQTELQSITRNWAAGFKPAKNGGGSLVLNINNDFFRLSVTIFNRESGWKYVLNLLGSEPLFGRYRDTWQQCAIDAYHRYSAYMADRYSKANLQHSLTHI